MADTNQVMNAASQLGALIGSHPSVKAYRELSRQMELDITARNLLGQFEQTMEQLAAKEANGMPIEVADKRNAEQLQQSIALHPLLKKLMAAQVEYMDLMRKVQEAINEGVTKGPGAEAQAPASPASKLILD